MADPNTWPIVTDVYRYWTGRVRICTVCRYEAVTGLMPVGKESEFHCYHCGTNVRGTFGWTMYEMGYCGDTCPLYICVGCIEAPRNVRIVPLTWGNDSEQSIIGKITPADKNSSDLLSILDEIDNMMKLRCLKYQGMGRESATEFAALMRFAKKL